MKQLALGIKDFHKGNGNIPDYVVKMTIKVFFFFTSFPNKSSGIFISLEDFPICFDPPDFMLMEIASEKLFLWQLHAQIIFLSIEVMQTCQQGNRPLLGSGERSCLLLLTKVNTESTNDFYHTCHIGWWRVG